MKLIKDEKYLIEDYRVKDLFELDEERIALYKNIQLSKDRSLIAFVGAYGSGKSTLLYQLADETKEKELWIFFDAWKYPERESLWEGFVLDVADQISNKEVVIKTIDGHAGKGETIMKGFVGSLFSTIAKIPIAPDLKPLSDAIVKAYEKAPVKRIFEIQEILREMLSIQELPIRIVIEDIDRSGDSGVYFLETLNHFMKNEKIDQEVKVIVPMATPNYVDPMKHESYIKSTDYAFDFSPKIKNMDILMNRVLSDDLFEPTNLPDQIDSSRVSSAALYDQLKRYLTQLILSGLSPRVFKALLRDWTLAYERHAADGLNPDYRVELLVQSSKYIKGISGNNVFSDFRTGNRIPKDSIFGAYILAIYSHRSDMLLQDGNYNFPEYDTGFADMQSGSIAMPQGQRAFPTYKIAVWYLR